MSIETLLTIVLALAILIAAAALRWMTLGILDLVLRLRGRETRSRARYISEVRRLTAATVSALYARLAPATARATATSTRVVVEGARRATAQIVVVATTLRRLAHSAYRAARELWTTTDPPRPVRRPQPPVERTEPEPERRVIDLNRQWDPLTDPFDPEDTLTWSR